jgi:hypothetical protein
VADRKSAQNPHQWRDGTWHSVTQAAHDAAMRALPVGNVPGLGAAALGGNTAPAKGVDRPVSAPAAPVAAAAAPVGAGAAPAGGSAQIVPDAQYLAEAAQRAFDRTTNIDRYTKEGTDDRADSAEAIRRLVTDAVQGRQTIKEGANKEGLYYSGQLSKRVGDYDTAVTRATGDISTQLQHREDARTAAIHALQQGAPLEDATALAAAGGRQTARDAIAADANALVPNAGPNVPAATAVPTVKPPKVNSKGQAYTEQAGSGGEWHVYGTGPNARRVWVPKRR